MHMLIVRNIVEIAILEFEALAELDFISGMTRGTGQSGTTFDRDDFGSELHRAPPLLFINSIAQTRPIPGTGAPMPGPAAATWPKCGISRKEPGLRGS